MVMMANVSLSEYFGFNPNSPYADLFSKIYHLTKVSPVEDVLEEEHEDGEIVEISVVNAPATVDSEDDQLTGDKDYYPRVDGDSMYQPPPSSDGWNRSWMKISKEAISWNLASNQNLTGNSLDMKMRRQTSPLLSSSHATILPVPPPHTLLQGAQGPSQGNNMFKGTNQINTNLFTPSGGETPNFSFPPPPPPFQMQSWAPNPYLQQECNLPGSGLMNSRFVLDQGRGGESNLASDGIGREKDSVAMESKGFDLRLQFDIDNNPVRQAWLLKYMDFQASRGDPLINCPAMYREPLDLFKLFNTVLEEGGFHKCNAKKCWKKIGEKMTANHKQPQLWRLLQKLYRRLLLQFESFEVGGVSQEVSMSTIGGERVERKALLPLPVQQWGEFPSFPGTDVDGIRSKWRKGGKGFKKQM